MKNKSSIILGLIGALLGLGYDYVQGKQMEIAVDQKVKEELDRRLGTADDSE